jgi:hypothetical protein
VADACEAGADELPCEDPARPPGDALALPDLPLEGMAAVPLNRPLGPGDTAADADPVVPVEGEKIAGMDDEDPAVQAETDAERRRVAVAHPAAVSLDLLTLMRPPCTQQAAA